MNNLKDNLKRSFWTNQDEMIKDIEAEKYDVLDITEYSIDVIDITKSDDEIETYEIVRANNTIAIR